MRRFALGLLASATCFTALATLAQEPPSQQAWVRRAESGSPLQIPRCPARDREMVERVSTGIATEFTARFELTVQQDGSITGVDVFDVLPEKSNPAKRWAMVEAKCIKKGRFDVARIPGATFPYTFEWRTSSTTSDRPIDSMDVNSMQRAVEENKKKPE